jgi:hypothetical protein
MGDDGREEHCLRPDDAFMTLEWDAIRLARHRERSMATQRRARGLLRFARDDEAGLSSRAFPIAC